MTTPGNDPSQPSWAAPSIITWRGVPWPEIQPGDDLVSRLGAIDDLRDGDIVLVTSKVVSKAEGRLVHDWRPAVTVAETERVVARRGVTVIAQTRHGLVLAAAGVDSSNTAPGTALALPLDPDRSARGLRAGLLTTTGLNVGVVVTDTAGRAWRLGQTDLAIGCAGVVPMIDLQGTRDTHGNWLMVTAPALADELAAAADLVKGKTSGRPVAVARGLASLVLPPGEHGPGATALVRPAADDLFGLGVREAVAAAALRRDRVALEHFPARTAGDPDPFEGLLSGWRSEQNEAGIRAELTRDDCPIGLPSPTWSLLVDVPDDVSDASLVGVGRLLERADTLAAAARLRSHSHEVARARAGRRPIARICWQDR